MKCIECSTELVGRQSKFCSPVCKTKHYKRSTYLATHSRGLERKQKAMNHLGGKCLHCGYCKNSSALCFHHKDESTKSFSLDIRAFSNRSDASLLNEVNKCILLCHNCHMELHYPHYVI